MEAENHGLPEESGVIPEQSTAEQNISGTSSAEEHDEGGATTESSAARIYLPPVRAKLPLRTAVAVRAAKITSRLSRSLGFGAGGMIGGRVALKLDPLALGRLCAGRRVALVTGTNGKTTTTLMLSTAVAALGRVASNHSGANMPDGLVSALASQPAAPIAVLEVDEGYFPAVAQQVRPEVVVLLNLSRDQLDRVGEVRGVERALRTVVTDLADCTVVANCDDVMMTSAAFDAPSVIWVSTGIGWHADSASCPRCGSPVVRDEIRWHCDCGLRRPEPDWAASRGELVVPGRPGPERLTLELALPGAVNEANAAMATAAANAMGAAVAESVARLRALRNVAGRYRVIERTGHTARLLLAKNPAGWTETLTMLDGTDSPVVVAVNGREADGRDLSWLWDVPFERLHGRPVIAAGERATDLAVRLTYAEVDHVVVPDSLRAIDLAQTGPVEVIANYTAFRDLNVKASHAH
ncbi:UDP-N-acetylmuramyl tripeptide synthase [Goodfellowiella coeruleoviolacea]|uniref:Lipid II isoglutaminyl synthase (glutamine-hydrolyzing) subunit MurT n=1 Tax=Goodfellowiella coeruleoviolacea TaxID=334858 RepID=A0AAE3GAY3_9PSEU|nr:UDP-N-acetylmuramyl tripeptide synthase [Goodfellowiella coeruleoviolacea]